MSITHQIYRDQKQDQMARIKEIRILPPGSRVHPTEAPLELREIAGFNGTRLVQLTTLGSSNRVSHEKPSQTIQIDAKSAEEIVKFIQRTFG